ncbi:hypothetical protein ACCT11_36220, partial [Rhizobium johnstonii]
MLVRSILLIKRLKSEIAPLALSTLLAGIGFIVASIPASFTVLLPAKASPSTAARTQAMPAIWL